MRVNWWKVLRPSGRPGKVRTPSRPAAGTTSCLVEIFILGSIRRSRESTQQSTVPQRVGSTSSCVQTRMRCSHWVMHLLRSRRALGTQVSVGNWTQPSLRSHASCRLDRLRRCTCRSFHNWVAPPWPSPRAGSPCGRQEHSSRALPACAVARSKTRQRSRSPKSIR